MNTKEKLMQLLELCIEKGLQFDHTPETNISVAKYSTRENNFYFRETVWLIYSQDDNNTNIDALITKVKKYTP